jgi:hypothetical protein
MALGRKDRELKTSNHTCFGGEKLNIQRPKLNYSYLIHLTSESSMWISKWMCFDEIFASAVSVHPSEQWFKKSNFGQLQSPFLIKLKSNLIILFCYIPTRRTTRRERFMPWWCGTFRWSIIWNVCSPTLGMQNWYAGILRSVGKIMRRFDTLQMEFSEKILIFNINHLDQKVEI